MAISHINEFFATVGGPVAIGAVLDQVVDRRHREEVAMYLFGFHNRPFAYFESNLIAALMSPFVRGQTLRQVKIVVGSALSTLAMIMIVARINRGGFMHLQEIIAVLPLAVALSIVAHPLDHLSMQITKKLFIDRSPKFPQSVGFIFVDFLSSTLPFGLLAYVVFISIDWTVDESLLIAGISLVLGAAAVSAGTISLLQAIILVVSVCLRSILVVSRLNNVLAMRSRIHKFPFTFVGLIVGLLLFAASLL